jgi:hypothetical protein
MIDKDAFVLFDTPNLTGTPERRLLLAVLERAILDFVGNDEKEMDQAKEWLFGDLEFGPSDPTATEFSFPWLCQQLDLDIENITEKIKAMPKRGTNRVAPWYFTRTIKAHNNDRAMVRTQKAS